MHASSEVRQSDVENTVPRYWGTGVEVGAGRPEDEDEARATEEEEADARADEEALAEAEDADADAEAETDEADAEPEADDLEADLVAMEDDADDDAAGSEGMGSCFFCRATSSGCPAAAPRMWGSARRPAAPESADAGGRRIRMNGVWDEVIWKAMGRIGCQT